MRTRTLSLVLVSLFVCAGCPDKAPPTAPPVAPPTAPPAPAPTPTAAPTPPAAPPATPGPTAPPAAPPSAPPSAPPPAATSGTGVSVSGRVLVKRAAEVPGPVPVTKDVPVCGESHDPKSLVLGAEGALAGAIVYLKGPSAPAGWDRTGKYEVDQKACRYTPRVMLVPEGAKLTLLNSDPVLHNVKWSSTFNGTFNESIPGNAKTEVTMKKAEFIQIGCSVHPFMGGAIVVQEHPWYAITDANGAFSLTNVPAGSWKLVVMHEVLGKADKAGTPITVADKPVTMDVVYK